MKKREKQKNDIVSFEIDDEFVPPASPVVIVPRERHSEILRQFMEDEEKKRRRMPILQTKL